MKKSQLKSFIFFTIILSISIYSLFDSSDQMKDLQKYFQNCEYEKAIDLAEIILKNPNLDKSDKTHAYIIKGVSEFSSNQTLNARITFAELIMFDKNVRLSEKEVSPKIIEFFNDLKQKLLAENI